MEAAGLAVGVVSLGLDLATRLQIYIDGVKGAGDRVSELTANVSATASVVQQLAALVEADAQEQRPKHKSNLEKCEDGTGPEPLIEEPNGSIFTPEGVYQIETLLRRCERIYKAIITLIGSATTDGFLGTKTLLTGVGVGDLTARRLARLKTKALWPWLEPRVQTCVKQLEAVKVDLLLNLQIASLAQCRIGTRKSVQQGEGRALKDMAKHLIEKKEMARNKEMARMTSFIPKRISTTPQGAEDSGVSSPRNPSRSTPFLSRSQQPAEYSFSNVRVLPRPPGRPDQRLLKSVRMSLPPPPPSQMPSWALGRSTTYSPAGNNPYEDFSSPADDFSLYPYRETNKHPRIAMEQEATQMLFRVDDATDQQTLKSEAELPESAPNDKQAPLSGSKEESERPAEASEDDVSHVDGMLIGAWEPNDEIEAWFVLRDSVDGPLSKVPVQGAAARKMLEVEDSSSSSTLEDYLTLAPDQRTAVQEIMDAMRRRDARLRTLVSLRRTDLPGGAKLVVLVATKTREQYVRFTDGDSQVWRVPYYGLKSAIVRGRGDVLTTEEELRNRCGSRALQEKGYTIRTDEGDKDGAITLYSLKEVLRPGMNLRIVSAAEYWKRTLRRRTRSSWVNPVSGSAGDAKPPTTPTPFLAEPTRPTLPQEPVSATYIPSWGTPGGPDRETGIGIPASPRPAFSLGPPSSGPQRHCAPVARAVVNESGRWSPDVSGHIQRDYPVTTVDWMEERQIMRELFGEEEIEAPANEEKSPSVDALLKRWTTTGGKKHSKASEKTG